MDLCIIRIILLLASSVWGAFSLAITNFTVPDFVRNGTEGSIQLDCEYTYKEEDKKLVVKWFHNDDTTALYQRIKQNKPRRVSDKFGDRLSTDDDELEDDNDSKSHLPLLLMRPTIEMSGTYSCEVTSTETMVSRKDEMIIYAIPSSISMNVSTVGDKLLVMCIVEGVFPLPAIEMFHTEPGEMDPDPVENVSLNFVKDNDAYDVFLTTNLSEPDLQETSGLHFFKCEVSIPGTEFKDEARMPYYPVSHGHRPGLRRKIHSEDGMMHSNDPEVLHLDINTFINEVAASDPQKGQRRDDDDDDDDDDGGGALDIRPSALVVLILASTLLVRCW